MHVSRSNVIFSISLSMNAMNKSPEMIGSEIAGVNSGAILLSWFLCGGNINAELL